MVATPSSIAICTLLALHSLDSSPLYEDSESEEDDRRLVEATIHRLLLLHSTGSSLSRIVQKLAVSQHSSLAKTFQQWLLTSVQSLDAFIDLMATLGQHAVTAEDTASASAMLLRQVALQWEELDFEDSLELYRDFQAEVEALPERPEELLTEDTATTIGSSQPADFEHYLYRQCLSLAFNGKPFSASTEKILDTSQLQEALARSSSPNAALLFQFYVFLNSLSEHDVTNTLQTLYAYIDAHRESDIRSLAPILSACVYQNGFGQTALAQAAITEAVRLAQHSQQHVAYALAWRGQLEAAVTSASASASLTAGLHCTLALQALEQPIYSTGASSEASMACPWVHLRLSTAHMASSTETEGGRGTTHDANNNSTSSTNQPTRLHALTHYHSARALQVAAVIAATRNSSTAVASSYLQAATQCYQVPLCDAETVIVNQSRLGLATALPSSTVDKSLTIYDQALLEIEAQCETYGIDLRESRLISTHIELLQLERMVRRGNLLTARSLLVSIQSSMRPNDCYNMLIDVHLQECLLLSKEGDYALVRTKFDALIERQQTKPTVVAELLLQRVVLVDLPQQAPFDLSNISKCMSLCQCHALMPLRSRAQVVLAVQKLRQGQAKDAVRVLRATIPILTNHAWYLGLAYTTLGEAYIQLEQYTAAIKTLERRAIVYWRMCDDLDRQLDITYLLAQTYNCLADTKKRDEKAEEFVQLQNCAKQQRMQDCGAGPAESHDSSLFLPLAVSITS